MYVKSIVNQQRATEQQLGSDPLFRTLPITLQIIVITPSGPRNLIQQGNLIQAGAIRAPRSGASDFEYRRGHLGVEMPVT